MDDRSFIFVVVVGTAFVLSMIGIVGFLMIVNTNRRHRYRADLAEAERKRDAEVMKAEREATQHTLQEVGRELHDNVGQLLAVAQMGLSTALDGDAKDGRLVAARDALGQGMEEVRRLAHSLNTDLWQERSLVDAIGAEAERLERVGRIKAHLLLHGEVPALPADVKTVLFRVFQEVVTNAVKHSEADMISITLNGAPHMALTITDNGLGFDPATTARNGGLTTIPRRCALIGFQATCTSAPGKGCTWHITPLTHDH
ncbi:MAG: histidine kinase [Flavobacteriales bacterium]